jgi:hypothetical protein
MFRDLLKDRRTLWWVDNEAARFSTIKGLSPSVTMRTLVREFYSLDLSHPMFSWIERVPSFSNPADGPSRSAPEQIMALLGVDTCMNSLPNFAKTSWSFEGVFSDQLAYCGQTSAQ